MRGGTTTHKQTGIIRCELYITQLKNKCLNGSVFFFVLICFVLIIYIAHWYLSVCAILALCIQCDEWVSVWVGGWRAVDVSIEFHYFMNGLFNLVTSSRM